jgi:iron complex transport system substrate-binding protein
MKTIIFGLLSTLALPAAGIAQDDPQRIVAIGGSLTEIVYALGEEDRLIARDTTSVFPREALELPDVGYMRALSPEGVLSVDPDLILTLEGAGPPEAMEVIRSASVPVVTVPESFDREGVLAKVEAVGEALGRQGEADTLAARIDADIRAAEAMADGVDEPARVLFILSMEGGRVLASGTGTAADGMIRLAGGENAITAYPGYKQLTDEAIVTAAPDVILMMDRGDNLDPAPVDLSAQPALSATPAAEAGRVIRMDGAFLLGFGPRTADAAKKLSAALYDDAPAD